MNNLLERFVAAALTSRRRRAWFAAARHIGAALVAVGVASCGGGDGSAPPSPGFVDGGEAPAVCNGADLSQLTTSVYVSTAGTDSGSCGQTTKTACETITQGLRNCYGVPGCGVIVRHGLYTEPTLFLQDGVNVYGGCRFDGEPDRRYRTVIQANTDPGEPALSAAGIQGVPTVVHGLVVVGKDETAASRASIAMVVKDSTALTLTGSLLSAGKGGDGETGGQPPAAVDGNPGGAPTLSFGTGVWSGDGGVGGAQCSYGGVSAAAGGHGADYNHILSSGCFITCACTHVGGTYGLPGEQGGSDAIGGVGGAVGSNGATCTGETFVPGAGSAGLPGSPAKCASTLADANANVWGQLTGTDWLPSSGGDGGLGDWGGGGGGGGAGGSCTHIAGDETDYFGSPGGGGGSGGCGGPGGRGGQQGGASIALVLDNAVLPALADQNAIVAGLGGRGGAGGQGSAGGVGGNGGKPDASNFTPACSGVARGNEGGFGANGGIGGKGGQGGAGGGGAGGNGGPSLAVALTKGSAPPAGGDGIYRGSPGLGGPGGSGGVNPNCSAAGAYPGIGGAGAGVVSMDSTPKNLMVAGQTVIDLRMTSPDGGTTLFLVANHLCVVHAGQEVCKALVGGFERPLEKLVMQTDGNLCLGDFADLCTDTAGHPGAYLAVLDDGTAAIFDGSIKLWTVP